MNLVAKQSLKTRYMAFLVAFVLMFCMVSTSMAPAMALNIDDLIDPNGNVTIEDSTSDPWADILQQAKDIVSGLLGILTLICFFFFALQIARIVMSASNESARAKAITGLAWAFVGIILFGGARYLLGYAWNVLKDNSSTSTPAPGGVIMMPFIRGMLPR